MDVLLQILNEILKFWGYLFFVLLVLCFIVPDLVFLVIAGVTRIIVRRRQEDPFSRKLSKVFRVLALVWIAVSLVAVGGLFVIDKYYFKESVRVIFDVVERKAGVEVEFSDAQGSLFGGELRLSDFHIKRTGHEISNFDITAREFSADIEVMKLLRKNYRFQNVSISGVSGNYERIGIPVDTDKSNIETTKDKIRFVYKTTVPIRRFSVQELDVKDVAIDFLDKTRLDREIRMDVVIDTCHTEQFGSHSPLYSVLFLTNMTGTINDHKFEVSHRDANGYHESCWQAKQLSSDFISGYVGGPIKWIKKADMDIDVTIKGRDGDIRDTGMLSVEMRYVLSDLVAEVPEEYKGKMKLFAHAVVKYLNGHADQCDLNFGFSIDRGKLTGHTSLEAAGLLKTIKDAMADEIARMAGIDKDKVKQKGKEVLDKAKGKFGKWLKKKE